MSELINKEIHGTPAPDFFDDDAGRLSRRAWGALLVLCGALFLRNKFSIPFVQTGHQSHQHNTLKC